MTKIMKKIVMGLTVIGIMLSCASCGDRGNAIEEAEAEVHQLMTDLHNVNDEVIKKYFGEDAFGEDGMNKELGKFMTGALGELEYKIIKSELTDTDTVAVTTEVTAVDIKPLMEELSTSVMEYAQSLIDEGKIPTGEETEAKVSELFEEILSRENNRKATSEIDIIVVKEDDGWNVRADDTLLNAVLGGILEAAGISATDN